MSFWKKNTEEQKGNDIGTSYGPTARQFGRAEMKNDKGTKEE